MLPSHALYYEAFQRFGYWRDYERWLLDLERKHFVELAQTAKTQDRIAHTMSTGKPLRN